MVGRKKEINKAVALSYKFGDLAPKILAKGEGKLADKILNIAKEKDIPIYSDKDVVEGLMALPTNSYIPEALYKVIADIIVWAYRYKGRI